MVTRPSGSYKPVRSELAHGETAQKTPTDVFDAVITPEIAEETHRDVGGESLAEG